MSSRTQTTNGYELHYHHHHQTTVHSISETCGAATRRPPYERQTAQPQASKPLPPPHQSWLRYPLPRVPALVLLSVAFDRPTALAACKVSCPCWGGPCVTACSRCHWARGGSRALTVLRGAQVRVPRRRMRLSVAAAHLPCTAGAGSAPGNWMYFGGSPPCSGLPRRVNPKHRVLRPE